MPASSVRLLFLRAVFSSAATDALVQMDSSAAVKVMALLKLSAEGTSVFPWLAAAVLCRAAGWRPIVVGGETAAANGSAARGNGALLYEGRTESHEQQFFVK